MVKKQKVSSKRKSTRSTKSHANISTRIVIGAIVALAILTVAFFQKEAGKEMPAPDRPSSLKITPTPTTTSSYEVSNTITPKAKDTVVAPGFLPVSDKYPTYGQVTSASCDGIGGFSFVREDQESTRITIMQYDPPKDPSKPSERAGAGIGGEANLESADVNMFYNIRGNHRFMIKTLPGELKNEPREFHVYATSRGGDYELIGSPVTLTCW